jgi:Zn-finger nucleic acid-binding protein
MSSVEEGLGGVWSCLYCEGTWLSPSQLQAVAAASGASAGANALASSLEVSPSAESLVCPGCLVANLKTVSLGTTIAHYCSNCGGAFFKKGIVGTCAPQVFSSSQEAPVVAALLGTIGAAALFSDPSLLIAALAYQPKR